MSEKEKTLEQFYADISTPVGGGGLRTAKVEKRSDQVVELRGPLSSQDDRVFFYAGLLYGFCRLDMSITERYREASGSSVQTLNYLVSSPLVHVAGFPEFSNTKVAHLLSSIEAGDHCDTFFEFMRSQLVVDRKRNVVWGISSIDIPILDPYLVDKRLPPEPVAVTVFFPYTGSMVYRPDAVSGQVPVVRSYREVNAALVKREAEVLRGS